MGRRVFEETFKKDGCSAFLSKGSAKAIAEELGINHDLLGRRRHLESSQVMGTTELTNEKS